MPILPPPSQKNPPYSDETQILAIWPGSRRHVTFTLFNTPPEGRAELYIVPQSRFSDGASAHRVKLATAKPAG